MLTFLFIKVNKKNLSIILKNGFFLDYKIIFFKFEIIFRKLKPIFGEFDMKIWLLFLE